MKMFDRLYLKVMDKLQSFVEEEKGESNIIAIVIVLGIVVALALLFGDKLMELFNSWWAKIQTPTP